MEEKSKKSQNRLYDRCFRCNRQLKSLESKKLGFGPTCYKKWKSNESLLKPLIGGDFDGTR